MDGDIEVDDKCIPSFVHESRTIVLLGRTGNGKSATGNSILGQTAFTSKMSPKGVTSTTDCQTVALVNGQVVNVIDTPGLFDFGIGAEEIRNCVSVAKDGIDAVLLVFSVGRHFTEEEQSVIKTLQRLLGPKITDYMIVIFTGGDNFDDDSLLQDYLTRCPEPLKEIIEICKNRYLLFDNKTKDENKKVLQLKNLLSLVDKVMEENQGQAYTDSMFAEFREEKANASFVLTQQIQNSNDEQIMQMTKMVESKLKEETEKLKLKVEAEKAARLKAEEAAKDTLKKTAQIGRYSLSAQIGRYSIFILILLLYFAKLKPFLDSILKG